MAAITGITMTGITMTGITMTGITVAVTDCGHGDMHGCMQRSRTTFPHPSSFYPIPSYYPVFEPRGRWGRRQQTDSQPQRGVPQTAHGHPF